MTLDHTDRAWLQELLDDAEASPRVTAWERSFLASIRTRFAEWGAALSISEAQMTVLHRIEGKIHAAG